MQIARVTCGITDKTIMALAFEITEKRNKFKI